MTPNQSLKRTRLGVVVGNRGFYWAGRLAFIVSHITRHDTRRRFPD